MHYRSLLFPGVLIATIASLLIVQSCTNKQDRADTDSDRAVAESDRADTKQDRESTAHDRELEYVGLQAVNYLNRCFTETRKPGRKPDCDQYVQYRSTLENWCESNDRDACNILLNLKKSEGKIVQIRSMEDLIGK
jgi:hypothetical protein